ncbi:MAG: DUF2442 domain-containing protein [Chitinivibrionales bacterium]|nr:DUF2442 domain-containing protein [Chitinivibrionales bacterium]
MHKILIISVPEYRKIHLKFDDGTEGIVRIDDDFIGIALPLQEPRVFATARIIDDGYAIGFENCDYDICAGWAYAQIAPAMPVTAAM